MRACVFLLAAVLSASTALAQSADLEVLKAEEGAVAARRTADAAALTALIADDFALVASNGQMQDKKYATTRPASPKYGTRESNVQVFGDVAVVTGLISGLGAADVRQTRVWQKQGGQWKMVFAHNTGVAAPPAAGQAPAAAPPGASAPDATNWPASGTSDEREVLKVQRGLNEAFANKDAATYATMTADTFVRIGPNGGITARPQFMTGVAATPDVKRVVSNNSEFRVRIYGPVAVSTYVDRAGGGPPAGVRMTRVYVKQNGAWKQLVGQSTTIAQQ